MTETASISITVFILVTTLTILLIAIKTPRFHKSPFANFMVRRSLIVLVFFLHAFNAGILGVIASHAGIPVEQEMWRYMWIFGFGGYIAAVILVIQTLFQMPRMWREAVLQKRMGESLDD